MTEIRNNESYVQLLKEAENNNSDAQYEVGNYFYDGLEINGEIIFKQNKIEAFKWIKKRLKMEMIMQ